MSIFNRNNINIVGSGTRTMLLAHGFGCDQNMWRLIIPAFSNEYRMVLFDHVGAGGSDLSQYRRDRYDSLHGYAEDVLEIIDATGIAPTVFVGHSVSAVIGALAAIKRPDAFDKLIMIGPSPSYINQDEYIGGFNRSDIEELLQTLDSNYLGWSAAMAPVIMGNTDRPALAAELSDSFCRTDPDIARHFAQVTFLSDNRDDLKSVKTPTLILQCSQDVIAPNAVGEYVHRSIPGSAIVTLQATGHCPHLSSPSETISAIQHYLSTT
jgi:sigma-B regulation protein RsbQ